jgi:beta-mannosidase
MSDLRQVIDLSGNHWKMEKMRVGAGVEEELHLLPAEYQGTYFSWNQATVPGDVYTDLHRAGELDDPYFGRNMGRVKWAQEYEWWYCHRFNLPESMQGKQIHIEFDGVDYECDVYLNGHLLGHHEGMFSGFTFEVTRYVNWSDWRGGSNILMVKLCPPPKNLRNVGGRKWFFSGDYMTGLVPMGIWRPVRVVATDVVKIDRLRIESDLRDGGTSGATVNVDVEMSCTLESPEEVTIRAVIAGKNFDSKEYGKSLTQLVRHGRDNVARLSFEIPDAQLWWPWDMGDQNLYSIRVVVDRNGLQQDVFEETFGVREIRMQQNPTITAEDAEFPWTFMINGKRHFLRSACWGGPPSFLYGRNSLKKYEDRLALVKEANINNLRIFGWHPPEIPDFYRLCDELGITVWTNFCFATQAFSAEPRFLDPALRECAEIIKDRRNHPSAIFWMGGEEVFFSGAHVVGDNKWIMEKIGEAVAEVTNVPYGLASPLSEHYGTSLGFKPKESVHANGHYYGAGKLMMEEFYAHLDFCVIPELTAASAPNVASLKKFIPAD